MFKNNLCFKNRTAPASGSADVDIKIFLDNIDADKFQGNEVIGNLFFNGVAGDAEVNVEGIGIKTLSYMETNHAAYFSSNLQVDPLLVGGQNPSTKEDFKGDTGSPILNAGENLTTTSSSGSGTVILVDDARYFYDGFGIRQGDTIKVGTNSEVVITEIDYGINQITVDTSITWASDDAVNIAYEGTAPNIGVWGEANGTPPPPPAPEVMDIKDDTYTLAVAP